jgi:hypothetical protein
VQNLGDPIVDQQTGVCVRRLTRRTLIVVPAYRHYHPTLHPCLVTEHSRPAHR